MIHPIAALGVYLLCVLAVVLFILLAGYKP
jgi:hypothetical protein